MRSKKLPLVAVVVFAVVMLPSSNPLDSAPGEMVLCAQSGLNDCWDVFDGVWIANASGGYCAYTGGCLQHWCAHDCGYNW